MRISAQARRVGAVSRSERWLPAENGNGAHEEDSRAVWPLCGQVRLGTRRSSGIIITINKDGAILHHCRCWQTTIQATTTKPNWHFQRS